ncbi:MAG: hypothetical protein F4Z14_02195 [Gammaproteobacteria bacterium]|nr:hypothetical protein [Gammaproteobacteria bacterium]
MNVRRIFGLLLLVIVSTPLGADSYVSLQLGLATTQSEIDVDVIHIGHPTYCDSVLYPDSSDAPTDGACALNQRQRAYAGLFEPEGGWFTSIAYGRIFGSWRVEGFFERNQFGSSKQLLPLAISGDSAILSKTNEWSQFQLPNNSYDDQGTSIFGLNVLLNFDLATGSGWSGYLGAGLGVASLDFNYEQEFLRKTVDEGYLDVPFPVDWPIEAKLNAAGSLSAIEESIQESTLTHSFIAGVDIDVGQDLTLGVRVTWRVVDDVEHDKALWTTIRSHAPVIADGRTPFESDFVFKSWSYLTIGLVATRHIGGNSR